MPNNAYVGCPRYSISRGCSRDDYADACSTDYALHVGAWSLYPAGAGRSALNSDLVWETAARSYDEAEGRINNG